jgi:hypothetical protein
MICNRKITIALLYMFTALLCSESAVSGENGVCRHCVKYRPAAIVLPEAYKGDAGVEFAANNLAGVMGGLYSATPSVVFDSDFKSLPADQGVVIVGRKNKSLEKLLPKWFQIPGGEIDEEAYRIVSSGISDYKTHLIAAIGGGARGDIFALAYLADALRISPRMVYTVAADNKPAFRIRIVSDDTRENALLYGYNTVFTPESYSRVVLLDNYDPDLFAGDEKQRDAIIARRAEFANALKLHDSLHLDSVSDSDEFEFHRALLQRPYASKLIRDKQSNHLCYCSRSLWDIYDAKYAEIVKNYPSLDYIMVRLGENYAGGDYFGNTPMTKNFMVDCIECLKVKYNDRIAGLINRTWNDTVDKSHLKYIHRTWETTDDGFHTSPAVYSDILGKIKNKTDLFMSVKFTKTDFWRYNFPNETIGLAGAPQIVEFQCAREYEGKGAFPDFIGGEISKGYRYAQAKGAVGVWNWHHGGGWNGPFLKTDLWNEANIYAASHLAWNPSAAPEGLAHDWATIKFGPENADNVTKILMLSGDAVLKLVYFEAYAKKKGSPWIPNENWVRDDIISGADRLGTIYRVAADDVPAMVSEKEEAVRIVNEMASIAAALDLPDDDKAKIVNSIRYEQLLAETLRDYSGAYFYFLRWKQTGADTDRRNASLYADSWKKSWSEYNGEIPKLQWTATLYKDNGMVKAMDEVFEGLTK